MPIDDEVDKLLGLIDKAEEKPAEPEPPRAEEAQNVASEALKPIEQPIKSLDATPQQTQSPPEGPTVDLRRMFDRMEDVTQNVLECARNDRAQAESAILMMQEAIETAHSLSKPASKTYVEGLIKAIEVKASINTTVVKIMEANAKMFAATKSGLQLNINNSNNSTVSSDDLVNLLNTPLDMDNEP